MYQTGDLVIYSAHGICEIVDISEITIAGKGRQYYVLQPIDNKERLTINAPVDQSEDQMQRLINKEEAYDIIESFKEEGVEWEERANVRYNAYNKIVQDGERKEIARVINTLMRKKIELEANDKRLHQKDDRLLQQVQDILWKELSLALDKTVGEVSKMMKDKIS